MQRDWKCRPFFMAPLPLNNRPPGRMEVCYCLSLWKKIAQSVAIVKHTTPPVAAGVEYKTSKG